VYQKRCSGYELTQDLNFDTDGNGVIDELDDYSNVNGEGVLEGWEPVGISGSNSTYFSTVLNGNGYAIKNLTINRSNLHQVGLFGMVSNSLIENLVIGGGNSLVIGGNNVGAIVGYAFSNSQIRNISSASKVQGDDFIGGLAGRVGPGIEIENAFVSGFVQGRNYVAGVAGYVYGSNSLISSISQVISTARVSAVYNFGGLLGSLSYGEVKNSYWAKDISGQQYSSRGSEVNSYVGVSLATLQCAIAENTDSSTGCVSEDGGAEGLSATMVLYKGWDPQVWDFGIAPNADQQLPGLKLSGGIVRDGDGDGVLDADDKWPDNRAASQDLDGDNFPDAWSLSCDDDCIQSSGLILDQFPHHAWAALDADFDGRPDGAENCAADCVLDGLTQDGSLGDYDNDGILDAVDADEDNDGIADVDADHDGLIDIDNLDKLNAMRFQLQGVGLQLSADLEMNISGCPFVIFEGVYQKRCAGYELTQDLDFDTDGNGVVDALDDYSNINDEGIAKGWKPVGSASQYFNGHFNGNGYVIKNLTINRSTESEVGLFGATKNSLLENVVIGGRNSSIFGNLRVGGIVGFALANTRLNKSFVAANIQGREYIGGLTGQVSPKVEIENSIVSGFVRGNNYVAGAVGYLSSPSSSLRNSVSNVVSIASISGSYNVGGLFSNSHYSDIKNSYWAKDVSGQLSSSGTTEANSYVGVNLAVLQCATSENTGSSTGCVSDDGSAEGLSAAMVLYKDWDPQVWDFGLAPNADQQLPGLKFSGRIVRDSDGDGVLDADDEWPNIYAASQDLDDDNYPDAWTLGCDDACIQDSGLVLDQFPHHAWAALDADFDGRPDGIENCTSDCELEGLIKDGALGDHDNDGILDTVDADEDNDGITDIDADHDGLIDIDSLDKLNAMRFQLQGIGLQLADDAEVLVSGCPFIIFEGVYQKRCSGYELIQDLDFDTDGNGIVDEFDGYSNVNDEGVVEGWEPVGIAGNSSTYFRATFNGNGYAIKNLTINRPNLSRVGLFGTAYNSHIKNLVIGGTSSSIIGRNYTAALAGYVASNTQIQNVSIAAYVQGNELVGGLVGSANLRVNIENVFVTGTVVGEPLFLHLVAAIAWAGW
jgi:hypothetical protein